MIDGARTKVEGDDAVIVPAGSRHNLINTGDEPLPLYTIHAPPEHRDGLVQKTKSEAARGEHLDGKATE